MMREVFRFDTAGQIAPLKTAEGFLLTEGKLAKAGVMLYKQADGTVIRELVEEDVLKDAASNVSLFGKALTLEHPPVDVTPLNWRTYAHGTWGGAIWKDDGQFGPGLYAPCTVNSNEMLTLLRDPSGPRELSPGYSVKIDDTPGEHPVHGPYDTRQIPGTRKYNHGAATREARGGRDLLLNRADSAYEVSEMENGEPKKDENNDKNESKLDAFMKEMRDNFKGMDARLSKLEKPPEKPKKDEEDKQDSFLEQYAERQKLEQLATRWGVKTDSVKSDELKRAIVVAAGYDEKRTDAAYIDVAIDTLANRKENDPFAHTPAFKKRTDGDDAPKDHAPDPNDFFNGISGK